MTYTKTEVEALVEHYFELDEGAVREDTRVMLIDLMTNVTKLDSTKFDIVYDHGFSGIPFRELESLLDLPRETIRRKYNEALIELTEAMNAGVT